MEKLIELGFKKHFPDPIGEKEYFYYRKDIKSFYLKGLHIIVEQPNNNSHINVYTKECDPFYLKTNKPSYRNDCLIYNCTFSDNNLLNVINFFENK